MQKGITTLAGIAIIIAFAVLALAGVFGYQYYSDKIQNFNTQNSNNQNTDSSQDNPQNQVVCAQDAKQCPDGSYVSRQPPTCAFAPCPSVDSTADWKTYTNTEYGFEIKYPSYTAEVTEQKGLWENKYNYTDIGFNILPKTQKRLRMFIREGVTSDYCRGLTQWRGKTNINGISFDYIPGFKWDRAMGTSFFASDYSTFKNDDCIELSFRVSYSASASEKDLDTEVFDEMISSFKFTK